VRGVIEIAQIMFQQLALLIRPCGDAFKRRIP
jgi:hypothetical protein